MKHAIILGFLLALSAHAEAHAVGHGSAVGGHASGAAGGMQNGAAAAARGAMGSTSAQGSGGRYSMVDDFQPWQEESMQQYAKPKFEPYRGE